HTHASYQLLPYTTLFRSVYMPMNWRLKPKEIQSVISDSGVKMIFYSLRHKESLTGTPEELLHMDVDSPEYDKICDPENRHPYGRSEEHTSELQSRFDLVC